MMAGEATPSQMGALLMALRVRGETVEEIAGAVTAMRASTPRRRVRARRPRRRPAQHEEAELHQPRQRT